MSLRDEVEGAEAEALRAKLNRAEAERSRARRIVEAQQRQIDALERVEQTLRRDLEPPKWLRPPKKAATGHQATLVVMLSDTHFDEVVNPEEMDGWNAYNREIAEMRLMRFAERAIVVPRTYMAGVNFDGIVLILGGDLNSGRIHDLEETNEDTTFGSIDHWSDRLATVIGMFADEFGKVFVPSTVGNHGRLTVKERTKRRVRDNADWAIARNLRRHFLSDDRVDFLIPESIDVPFEVYDTKFLLYHGQTGGGQGIGGIWPPIMRLRAAKMDRYPNRILVMGHHHQYVPVTEKGILVNGSLKGFDEYCVGKHFSPERPTQAMFTVSPEYGVTNHYPIFVEDRKAEGW